MCLESGINRTLSGKKENLSVAKRRLYFALISFRTRSISMSMFYQRRHTEEALEMDLMTKVVVVVMIMMMMMMMMMMITMITMMRMVVVMIVLIIMMIKNMVEQTFLGFKIETYFVIFAIRIAFFSDALIHKSLEK